MQVIFHTERTQLIETVNAFIDEWNSSSTTIEVQTSGSTGTPKRIIIEKKHMKASAQMTGTYLGLKEGNTALLCLSPETIAGKMMIVRAIVLGLQLIVVDVTSDPLAAVDEPLNFVAMVPMQVEKSLETQPDRFKEIEQLIIGGAPVSPALQKKLSGMKNAIFQTFGMTETLSHVAMRKLGGTLEAYNALPNVHFDSEDDQLIIYAPNLGVSGLKTNDIIELNSPTSFHWLGRADFVINSGGIKIHPESIEEQLSSIITTPFFSFGIPDEQLGTKHILCIENTESNVPDSSSIHQVLDSKIAPKEVYYFSRFQYTTSGKINRIATVNLLARAQKQVL